MLLQMFRIQRPQLSLLSTSLLQAAVLAVDGKQQVVEQGAIVQAFLERHLAAVLQQNLHSLSLLAQHTQ